MALIDRIKLGTVLPHRSMDALSTEMITRVAQRAESLGFEDLWVTENTLDHAISLDPMLILTHAAAVTARIRLGVSVVVLPVHNPIHVAHQAVSLDHLSHGRAILGVGIGRDQHYQEFQVPVAKRVRRFNESIAIMRALWRDDKVDFDGEIYQLVHAHMSLKPVQEPSIPVWIGGMHPDAVRRSARLADGWMGAGGQTSESFAASVPLLRQALESQGKDPATYPISKRVFMAVDENPQRARAEVHRWFCEVYKTDQQTDAAGVHGTPEQVREQLELLIDMGANHLLLNSVSNFEEQVEALAELIA